MQKYEDNEKARTYILLDSRFKEDFDKGHIKGSISFPFTKLIN